jgi:hypothetical protein
VLAVRMDTACTAFATTNNYITFSANGTTSGAVQGIAGKASCNDTPVLSYRTSGADYAEYFSFNPANKAEAHELVSYVSATDARVERSTDHALPIIGAVSFGTAGFIGNGATCPEATADVCEAEFENNNTLVSLVGQVKVKVNTSNGPINVGDPIGLSATPGIGAKMIGAGYIIGFAQAALTSGEAELHTLIRPQYYTPAMTDVLQGTNMSLSGNAAIAGNLNVGGITTLGELQVTGNATIAGTLTVTGATNLADITVNGHIISAGNAPEVLALVTDATVSVDGNDTAGTITITIPENAANLSAGELARLAFTKQYGRTPRVIISSSDQLSAAMRVFTTGRTPTEFKLGSGAIPIPGQTYTFDYFVIE